MAISVVHVAGGKDEATVDGLRSHDAGAEWRSGPLMPTALLSPTSKRRGPLWILLLFLGALLVSLALLVTWPGRWDFLSATMQQPFGCPTLNSSPSPGGSPNGSSSEIHVFYHIWSKDDPESMARAKEIVLEQQAQLRDSGLEQEAAAVHYSVFGGLWKELVLQPTALYRKNKVSGPGGSEGDTLQLLWEHCRQAPQDRVLYIHSKGTFTTNVPNDAFRRALMHSVLDPCCREAIRGGKEGGRQGLDSQTQTSEDTGSGGYDVCGMRYGPIPYIAYHGNMWWASCAYIQRLIPPREFPGAMDRAAKAAYSDDLKANQGWARGMGRGAFEHWVGSHPLLQAVDNLPVGTSPGNATYVTSYDFLPDIEKLPWKPLCSPAPRAEIPLDKYLEHPIFPSSPLPSRQWKEFSYLYGCTSRSAAGQRTKRRSVSSICLFWRWLGNASLPQDGFIQAWLDDYRSKRVHLMCPSDGQLGWAPS